MVFKKLITAYVHKAWISALVSIVFAAIWFASASWYAVTSGSLTEILIWFVGFSMVLWIISTVGLLITAVYFLVQKKWWSALGRTALCVGSVVLGLGMMLANFLIIESKPDNFADNLTIPPALKLSIPLASHQELVKQPDRPHIQDGFYNALLVAGKTKRPYQRTIHTDIPALFTLQRDHRDLLHRYLACSPAWRAFEEDGHRYAMRRWYSAPHWPFIARLYQCRYIQRKNCSWTRWVELI